MMYQRLVKRLGRQDIPTGQTRRRGHKTARTDIQDGQRQDIRDIKQPGQTDRYIGQTRYTRHMTGIDCFRYCCVLNDEIHNMDLNTSQKESPHYFRDQ